MPVVRFPKIPNILKGLELESNPFQGQLDTVVQGKPHLIELVSKIDAGFSDPDISSSLKGSIKGIFTGDEGVIKSLSAAVETRTRGKTLGERLYDFGAKGATNKGSHGAINNINLVVRQDVRNLDLSSRNNRQQFEQSVSKDLREIGFEAVSTFELLHTNPKKFEEVIGIPQKKVFEAYINNTKTGIKSVDDVIGVLKKNDDVLIKSLQKRGIEIGNKANYILPFNVTKNALYREGEEAIAALLLKTTKFSPKQIEGVIKGLEDAPNIKGVGKGNSVFAVSTADFKDGASALHFFETINGKEFSDHILASFLHNKGRLIQKATLIEQLGPNPLEAFKEGLDKAVGKLKKEGNLLEGPETDKIIGSIVKDFKNRLNAYNGDTFFDSEFWGQLGKAFNQSLSLITASTARSTLRNAVLDGEGSALALGNSLYNGNYEVGGSAGRIFRNFSYLAKQTVGGAKQKEAVNNILDIVGYSSSLDNLVRYNLMSFEDFLESSTSKVATDVIGKANSALAGSSDTLTRISGNHSLYDFLRARRAVTLQQMFTNTLKHFSWKEMVDSLSPIELKQLDAMNVLFGYNENSWNFLKHAETTKIKMDNATAKSLGFGDFPEFITKESILDVPDSIALKYKKPTQTAKSYKQEVARNWQKLIYITGNNAAPTTTLADSVTVGLLSNTPDALSFTLRPFLKFGDVSQTQFNVNREMVALSTHGDASSYIGYDKSLIKWGKVGARYAAYTAAVVWSKDLLWGRKPRDFTDVKNALGLFELSGFGGFPAQVISSVLPESLQNFNSYGGPQGVFSNTPAEALYNKPASLVKALFFESKEKNRPYNIAKALHNTQPYSNLWYAGGVVDAILENIFLSKRQRDLLHKRREDYGVKKLF